MKKSVIFISISLVLIILLGIGVSYSMWNISVSQDTTNMAESKCFDLSISNQENSINLDNAYPISNDKGKSLTPYTFTVTNTCDITTQYNINLEVLNSSTLSSKFIDVMFEGNINLLSSYDTTDKVNTSNIESRKLTTGILKYQESKDYSLRLWMDYNTTLEDLNNEIKSFESKIVVVGKPINYTGDTVFNFDYTGAEQTFVAPVSGIYRLETWGAAGGYGFDDTRSTGGGGYGGYSSGHIKLKKSKILYFNIGGKGEDNCETKKCSGGYNGGSDSSKWASEDGKGLYTGGGGGATHIAKISGLLETLENFKDDIIIVSGAGGGGDYYPMWEYVSTRGSGGGFKGVNASGNNNESGEKLFAVFNNTAGTQENGYIFGKAGTTYTKDSCGGSGGGYYGGISQHQHASGAGGSGYIGNSLLTNKVMYCYNCEETNEESTKTISTTCNEETPTSYCAKKGNGYARITLVSIDE